MTQTLHTSRTTAAGRTVLVSAAKSVRFDQPVTLANGKTLPGVEVAYETYGTLNAAKSNAVLICHALSGDSHVCGYKPGENPDDPATKPGWWDIFVGPGKAIDTDRYFVICPNVLGGCKGTTGPGSVNPDTGKPWGLDFPVITIADMVDVQRMLIDHLGIKQLLCVTGGSMGGMQVLEWAVRYPDRVYGAIPIATTASLSAQSLAFDAVGRQAIQSDPAFHGGQYAQRNANPARGLAIARMLGHITYLSEQMMHEKFGRSLRHGNALNYNFDSQFSVETYLDYQGDKFVERFDANTYLYLTRAMDYFDLAEGRGSLQQALARARARFLIISFHSDWLFRPAQSQQLVAALTRAGRTVSYLNLPADAGHDSFLIENEHQERAIRGFLNRLLVEAEGGLLDALPLRESDDERLDLDQIQQFVGDGESVLDLGCGDGRFLLFLARQRNCRRGQGVDIDLDECLKCIEHGVDVIQADLDQPLTYFADKSFDVVVLGRTLQIVRHPPRVVNEMLRIGSKGVVTFPNFGYWRNRNYIAWLGRVPISRNLPFTWADTPNLHYLSMKDFEDWCADSRVRILQRIAMDYASTSRIRFLPNLRATDAIYVIAAK